MNTLDTKLFRTGAFAKKAGVTIRTLRFYDKQNLLKPTEYTESGQRLYSEKDLGRLQQILTLKFIGLSLTQIGELLTNDPEGIARLVSQQKQVMVDRILQLQHVIHALDRAETTWKATQTLDWDQFAEIIKAVNMSKQNDWGQKFFNEDAKKAIDARRHEWNPQMQEEITQKWNDLYADVRANMNRDINSPEVQKLVDRWTGLVGLFTQGNAQVQEGLNKMWHSIDENAPEHIRKPFEENKDVFAFMEKAIQARKK